MQHGRPGVASYNSSRRQYLRRKNARFRPTFMFHDVAFRSDPDRPLPPRGRSTVSAEHARRARKNASAMWATFPPKTFGCPDVGNRLSSPTPRRERRVSWPKLPLSPPSGSGAAQRSQWTASQAGSVIHASEESVASNSPITSDAQPLPPGTLSAPKYTSRTRRGSTM